MFTVKVGVSLDPVQRQYNIQRRAEKARVAVNDVVRSADKAISDMTGMKKGTSEDGSVGEFRESAAICIVEQARL